MIKIIRFELLKVIKSKVLLLAFLLCIIQVASLQFFEYKAFDSPRQFITLYRTELDKYKSKTPSEIKKEIIEEVDRINVFLSLSSVDDEQYESVLHTYQTLYPKQVEQYLSGELNYEKSEAQILKKVLSKINNDKTYIDTFSKKIEQVIQQSELMQNISVFSQSDESSKNIIKTANDYERLQGISVKMDNHLAFERFVTNDHSYLFALVIMIFAASTLTITEKHAGVNILINSTLFGGRRTTFSKIIALICLSLFATLFFYLTSLSYYHFIYNFCNLTDYVQSCSGLGDFTLPINCFQTIVLMVFVRWISVLAISLIVFTLLHKTGNSSLVAGMIISFLTLEGIFVYFVSFQSNLCLLRYFNIFTFLDIHFSIFEYHNVFVFGKIFSMKLIVMLFFLLLLALSVVTALVHFKEYVHSKHTYLGFRRIESVFTSHSCILLHEIYNSFIHNMGVIVLVILCVYFGAKMDVYQPHHLGNSYFQMIQKFEGKVDNIKEQELKEYIDYVEKAEYELADSYNKMKTGEVSPDEYYERWKESYELINHSNTLTEIQFQLMRVPYPEKAIVDYEGYKVLFDYENNSFVFNGAVADYVVLVLGLSLCVAPLFAAENQKNISDIYLVTQRGGSARYVAKILVAILYAGVITAIYSCWKYSAVDQYYSLVNGNEMLWNLPDLHLLSDFLTLNQTYLVQSLIRCGQLTMLAVFTLLISKYSKTVFSALIKSLIIILFPVILVFTGFGFIETFLPIGYFLSVESFQIDLSFVGKQIVSVMVIICSILMVLIPLNQIINKVKLK